MTSLHCSSLCISTSKCSAFSFNDESKSCQLGSNLKLVNEDSSLLTDPLMPVQSFYSAGSMEFLTRTTSTSVVPNLFPIAEHF
jgi:hypothetical protein